MRAPARLSLILSLLTLVACSDYDGAAAANEAETPAAAVDETAAAPPPAATASPSAPATTNAPAPAPAPAPPHATSFCSEQAAALGTRLVFCSDFDDASSPLAAWRGGSIDHDAFVVDASSDGHATVDGGKLTLSRPDGGRATYHAEIPLPASAVHVLHVAFDVKATHPGAHDASFFTLGGAVGVDTVDRGGSPRFIVRSAWSHAFLPAAPVSTAASTHVELTFAPNADRTYDFAGTFDGVTTKEEFPTAYHFADGEVLTLDLGVNRGKETPNAAVPPIDAATLVYDNILVTAE